MVRPVVDRRLTGGILDVPLDRQKVPEGPETAGVTAVQGLASLAPKPLDVSTLRLMARSRH